jgi:putative sterol carrier protein
MHRRPRTACTRGHVVERHTHMSTIAPISTAAATRAAAPSAREILRAAAADASGARSVDTAFLGGPRKSGGASVQDRFNSLEERFLPEKAKGVDVKLQFNLSGSDGGEWYVVIKDGKIKVTKGKGGKADATVSATAKDYKKMAEGDMNKTIAFLRGKLKIEGDRKYLDAWETWFKDA